MKKHVQYLLHFFLKQMLFLSADKYETSIEKLVIINQSKHSERLLTMYFHCVVFSPIVLFLLTFVYREEKKQIPQLFKLEKASTFFACFLRWKFDFVLFNGSLFGLSGICRLFSGEFESNRTNRLLTKLGRILIKKLEK